MLVIMAITELNSSVLVLLRPPLPLSLTDLSPSEVAEEVWKRLEVSCSKASAVSACPSSAPLEVLAQGESEKRLEMLKYQNHSSDWMRSVFFYLGDVW